jgi:hypothetical protein
VLGLDSLAANAEDEQPNEHRHVSHPSENPLPERLFHLARWIGRISDHPATAWWAASKGQLHPVARTLIASLLERHTSIPEVVATTWRLLFEAFDDSVRSRDVNQFQLLATIKRHGWQPSCLRAFARLMRPWLSVRQPIFKAPKPPAPPFDGLSIGDLADFTLNFPDLADFTSNLPREQLEASVATSHQVSRHSSGSRRSDTRSEFIAAPLRLRKAT